MKVNFIRIIQPCSMSTIQPGTILVGEEPMEEVQFMVASASRVWMEWRPDGPLAKHHGSNPAVLADCLPQTHEQRISGRYSHPNGNDVQEYTVYDTSRGRLVLSVHMSDQLGVLTPGCSYVLQTAEKTHPTKGINYFIFQQVLG